MPYDKLGVSPRLDANRRVGMMVLTGQQMLVIERSATCSSVLRFVEACCHRDDFKRWVGDRPRVDALWWPLWPACRQHSEHDLALAMVMVMLAAAAHEGIQLGEALPVLRDIGANEVRLKIWLVERGYFDYTAFDTHPER